jgi:ssDNA-binding Zn-finger/Zn-ribbon topoisomerase 1
MVRYVWWSEHERLCASGVITSVRGHFKGLQNALPDIRKRYDFAKLVAEKGSNWGDQFITRGAPCPQCNKPTYYYSREKHEHAWFDRVGYKWVTHKCMSDIITECQPAKAAQKYTPKTIAERRPLILVRKKKKVQISQDLKLIEEQKRSPIQTNHVCPDCNSAVYKFQSSNGRQALFDTLEPTWSVHACLASNTEPVGASSEQTNIKLADLKSIFEKPGITPEIGSTLENMTQLGLPYVLCQVLNITRYQKGFRIRLNPLSLPKVDIVIFGRFLENQINGLNFVYLKENHIKFLSLHSLLPIEAEIEYHDIRRM